MQLQTTTSGGDKVLARSIAEYCDISMDELTQYSSKTDTKIKTPQQLLDLKDAHRLISHIQNEKCKIYFDPQEWQSFSSLDDFQNLLCFIDKVLQTIQTQEARHQETLRDCNRAYKTLQSLEVQNAHLLEVKDFLLSKFDFSLENFKDNLMAMRSQILEHLERVDASTCIFEDEQNSHKPINFNFTARKIVRNYENQMQKIKGFSQFAQFLDSLLEAFTTAKNGDETFQIHDKAKLESILKEDRLQDHSETLYQEWASENQRINALYLPFIKSYFRDIIAENTVLTLFEILHNIKKDVEEFYLNTRSGLLIKYKENPKSDMLQEVATKERIFKIYQKYQKDFIALIGEEKESTACRFLNQLLGELLDFSFDKESKDHSEMYQKIAKWHSVNLKIYLNDVEEYGKALEQKDMQIAKLLFKMQQDLENSKE